MYVVPAGITATVTTAKSAKGEATVFAKSERPSKPEVREREIMAIPRDQNGWDSLVIHWAGLGMVARRENSVQRIDHHNLGLVPADGDDVAQEAVTQAMAMRAIAELKSLDLNDTDDRVTARAIAVATLDPATVEELEAELAELQAPRYEFTSADHLRKTSYKRATANLEAHLDNKLQGDDYAEFRKLFAIQQPTAGEALRERHHVHSRLNAKAMRMVRGMSQFGYQVNADTSEWVADVDASGSLFVTLSVDESHEESRRAKLAYALGNKVKRGQHATQGLLLLLDLAGYRLVSKSGKVQFKKDGSVKLHEQRPKTIAELEAEHGWDFFQKAKRDAMTFMATL